MRKYQILVAIIAFVSLSLTTSYGQIYFGNGEIVTQTFEAEKFTSVIIETGAIVDIELQQEPSIEITGDKNLLMENLRVETKGGILYISPIGWIEATQKLKINISAEMISYVEPSGSGTYHIKNIDTPSFVVKSRKSDITLEGTTQNLIINTKTGDIDASQLVSQNSQIYIDGKGIVKVNTNQSLDGTIDGKGEIIYAGNPEYVKENLMGRKAKIVRAPAN